jgi:thioredoxin 1|tara:strand:+ start:382 stop:705 length:324 start_codon:yes stop_codon:yes gene_type:complete
MAILEVTDENFQEKVLQNSKPFCLRFTAEWCAPCKALATIVESISNEMDNVDFGAMDIDKDPNTPIRPEFSVRGIPTCAIIVSGEVKSLKVGLTTKQDFTNWIKENI